MRSRLWLCAAAVAATAVATTVAETVTVALQMRSQLRLCAAAVEATAVTATVAETATVAPSPAAACMFRVARCIPRKRRFTTTLDTTIQRRLTIGTVSMSFSQKIARWLCRHYQCSSNRQSSCCSICSAICEGIFTSQMTSHMFYPPVPDGNTVGPRSLQYSSNQIRNCKLLAI